MSLVLDIDGTGIDRSRFRTNMSKVGKVVLGGRPKYDGSTGYLLNSTPDWRSGDSQGTIMAWIKRNAVGANHVILASNDEASANWRFISYVSSGNALVMSTRLNGAAFDSVTGDTAIAADKWYHIAITSAWALYVNGEPEALTPGGAGNTGDWLADVLNRDNITFGVEKFSSLASYFNGSIDDVKVYDEELAADWIKAYYEQSRQHRLSA